MQNIDMTKVPEVIKEDVEDFIRLEKEIEEAYADGKYVDASELEGAHSDVAISIASYLIKGYQNTEEKEENHG